MAKTYEKSIVEKQYVEKGLLSVKITYLDCYVKRETIFILNTEIYLIRTSVLP
jgi:hypothetical protein